MRYLIVLLIIYSLLFVGITYGQQQGGGAGYQNVVINPTDELKDSCGVTGNGVTTAGATDTNTGPGCTATSSNSNSLNIDGGSGSSGSSGSSNTPSNEPTSAHSCGVTGNGVTTAGATDTNTGPGCTGSISAESIYIKNDYTFYS